MPNNYFQFKKFIIHQDQCAMKVCTDACILGAWFAKKISNFSEVLDIGSGTGLLMLMLAQKSKASISGIEIDPQAYKQLRENTGQSKWANRFKLYAGDVRVHSFHEKFDFIISNPPFFDNDLVSIVNEKNIAKHSKGLSLKELMEAIDTNLDSSGSFGILLPYHRGAYFEELAKSYQFHLKEKLLVKQTVSHSYFRTILHFSKNQLGAADEFTLTIQESEGKYSSDFIELMKDYYLKL